MLKSWRRFSAGLVCLAVLALPSAVADAAANAGGKVVGIMPKSIMAREVNREGCDEFLITECMRTRKAALEQRGDAFIALPGGLGTFEEIL